MNNHPLFCKCQECYEAMIGDQPRADVEAYEAEMEAAYAEIRAQIEECSVYCSECRMPLNEHHDCI